MIRLSFIALLAALPSTAMAAGAALSPEDQTAAYSAAGFELQDGQWRACDDPGTASYTPGAIEVTDDINGDGAPDALITEGGSFCFGNTGQGFSLVSKQADGGWKMMASGTGIVRFLTTKGQGGWPDIEIGGTGFCFPVLRWNGTEYRLNRHEYQDKPCKHAF